MGKTTVGNVEIEWFGHASFKLKGSVVVYIDPFILPDSVEKADIVLMTHEHFDHCVGDKLGVLAKPDTVVVTTEGCSSKLHGYDVIKVKEGDEVEVKGVKIKAVPAYNVNKHFHPRGLGVGFVVNLDGVKIYHAGDTDVIPEMKDLSSEGIDVALLPIGGTYTMDDVEAAEAVKLIKPKIVIPMHYNSLEGLEKDPTKFKELVGDEAEVVIL